MQNYHDLVSEILQNGEFRNDRTGTGTRSVFGRQLRYDLTHGFPLLTTKYTHFKSIAYELIWMLRGEGNIQFLRENNVTIWDEWADAQGNLGPVYGVQWRSWRAETGHVTDQIAQLIHDLKQNPNSRRHVVSAWNVGELNKMALPPCHLLFQFYVRKDKYLDCMMTQRSADVFLGLPFNIASYALLTHILAQITGYTAGELIVSIGDAHLYVNHIEQAKVMLTRQHLPPPKLTINPNLHDINTLQFQDINLMNYQHHGKLKAEVAV